METGGRWDGGSDVGGFGTEVGGGVALVLVGLNLSGALETLSRSLTGLRYTVRHAAAPGWPALDLPAGTTVRVLTMIGLDVSKSDGDVHGSLVRNAEAGRADQDASRIACRASRMSRTSCSTSCSSMNGERMKLFRPTIGSP